MRRRRLKDMEEAEEVKQLVSELDYYAKQVDSIGTILLDLAKAKKRNQKLFAKAANVYQLLILDMTEIYNEIKHLYQWTARKPRPSGQGVRQTTTGQGT